MMLNQRNTLRSSVLIVALLLTCFVSGISAAVTVDSAATNGVFESTLPTGATNLTWNHTVNPGISQALFVGISTTGLPVPLAQCPIAPCIGFGGTLGSRVDSIDYAGQPMTSVGLVVSPDQNNAVEIFRILDPTPGTNLVNVNFNLFLVSHAVGGSVSFNGVDPANPNGLFFSSSSANANASVTVTDSVTGDIVFDTLATSPDGGFVGIPLTEPNQMLRWNGRANFFIAYDIGAGSTEPASSPVTTNWIFSGSNTNHALGAVAVKSFAPSAALGRIRGRVLNHQNRGIPNVTLTLQKDNGSFATGRTNPFGYFEFNELATSESYVLDAHSKQYNFQSRLITLSDSVLNITLFPDGK